MGVKITSENIEEYITSFIDRQYQTDEERQRVKELIDNDELVYKKYKTELLTRDLFREKLFQEELPSTTFVKINNSIDGLVFSAIEAKKNTEHQYAQTRESHFNLPFLAYLKKQLTSRISLKWVAVPAYSFAVLFFIILAAVSLFVHNNQSSGINPFVATGSDKSVMVQAVSNFHKILAGDMNPLLNSTDENEVCDYLKNGTKFDAYVPCLKNCDLKGAAFNEYNGQKLAHIVYTSGKEVIYIYETHISSIHCKSLELPEPVHNQMIADKYYMCDHADADGCTLMLWFKDSLLCASVSKMSKHKLYNTLVSLK
jgi:hypothetical protein